MPAATTENENIAILTDAQLKNGNVSVGKFEEKKISSVIRVNGKIDVPPQNMISVSAPLGGYLKRTHLLPGMHVGRGEAIASMEDQQFIQLQQDYLMAKSKLHFAQLDYKRQKELNQSQASSDKAMQLAQSEANSQGILMNGLAEKLRMININPATVSGNRLTRMVNIYSPINGFVTRINVNIGKYVNPSEVMFELVNPEDIHLNLKVFERDVRKLYVGQRLTAYSNANPDKKYSCEILLISKDISPEGTNEVHCHFVKYDPLLIPGMYMNAEIQLDSRTVNALPEDAIVSFGGKQYLFEETGKKKFEMKEVNTGNAENGYVAIMNANEFAGKSIVVKGAYALLMKLKNKEE
ncbi:MAG: efflux RND transporter periplasmic adaptor subunit [Ferruginibacter sp.]